MTLIKTSILSFIATFVKIIAALVINKAVAIFIGPTGLALIGQFQNFVQLTMTFAQGGINTGVTKYVAEYGKDGDRIPILLSTASKIILASSTAVGLSVILLSEFASIHFLKKPDYSYIFIILGITIILMAVNSFLLSILNGLKEIKTFIAINIIQSIYSLIFTSLLIIWLGLDGVLIALVTNQSVILLVVIYLLRRHPVIKLENFKASFNSHEGKKLLGYSAMALVSASTIPVSHLVVRNYIGENIGWAQAGYWQAIWYISTMYLMVITTTLSIYYLPKLSELSDKSDLRREIYQGYRIIMPIVFMLSITIFLLKDFIIWLLFTEEFAPVRELFMWQLIGDVIKITSYILGTILKAKAMYKGFIKKEIFVSLVFIVTSILLIDNYGLMGVIYSYVFTYTVNLFWVILLVRTRVW